MIFTKIDYETYNSKLLAIIEAFKSRNHYLEGFKHKVIVFIDQNNFQYFIKYKKLEL